MPLTSYKWSNIAPLCAPRVYTSVACCNGLLYVIGGCDEMGKPVNTNEAYDPKANSWTKLRSMPTKRAAPILAAFDDIIVAIGGVGHTQAPVDSVELYLVAENKWKKLVPLSEALMGMASVARENKIYIFGGMAVDSNPRDHFKCLVFASGGGEKWQAFPPMPTPRYAAQAFYKNSKVYVLGGRSGKMPVDTFEVFDFDSRVWCSYPRIPTKRVFPCYASTDHHLVSLGGLRQTVQAGFCDTCEIYPVEQNERGEWTSNKRMVMPNKRGDFAAATIDNQVIVAGGLSNDGKPHCSTEVFDPESKKWKRVNDMPDGHCTCSSLVYQGKFYLFGGIMPEGPTSTCLVFEEPAEDSS